jgi:signal transduction histidine kinase
MKYLLKIILLVLFLASFFSAKVHCNNNELSQKVSPELIDSLNNLSYKNRRNNPKLSLEYAIKAYDLCNQIDYIHGLATAIHNKGTAAAILGRFDLGMIDLAEASRIREEIGDFEGIISTFNNIGFIFSEMGNDKEALEYYQKSLEYKEKTGSTKDIGITLNNIGWVYFRGSKYDLALTYFYRALAANEEDSDQRGVGASKSNIGTIYRYMGESQKGLDFHYQALENAQQFNDKVGMISILREISEDYFSMKKVDKAANYAAKSLSMAKEIGSLSEEKNSATLLANIFETKQQYKDATKLYKRVSQLNDSLFSKEKAEVLGQIKITYELEARAKENLLLRKEQEINSQRIRNQKYFLFLSFAFTAIAVAFIFFIISINRKVKVTNLQLKHKNSEIEKQKEIIQEKANAVDEKNKELEKINQIKDKLIAVIAHDLKNPFNSISGYSEVLLSQFDSYSKNEIQSFLRIIYDSSNKGNVLLDNLLQWSMLQTKTLKFLPIRQNLYKLVSEELIYVQYIAKEKNIQIFNHIPRDIQIDADSNMLKTIIRNLVSNAIKYTGLNGTITLTAANIDSEINVSVEDTGIGIEPFIKEKLFTGEIGVTTKGQGGEKGTGIGLMLCKDFIDMHNGKIWIESEIKKGAKIYFSIPNLDKN